MPKYGHTHQIRGKQKTKIKPSFIIDGTLVEERRVIADSFNKYFTSIASKLNESDDELLITPLPAFTDYIRNSMEVVSSSMNVIHLKLKT